MVGVTKACRPTVGLHPIPTTDPPWPPLSLSHPPPPNSRGNDYVITLQRHASCSRLGFSHSLVFCMGFMSQYCQIDTVNAYLPMLFATWYNIEQQYDWSVKVSDRVAMVWQPNQLWVLKHQNLSNSDQNLSNQLLSGQLEAKACQNSKI